MPNAKAVVIREPGGPEVLELGSVDLPDPGPTQVLVQVAAAGLNRADCLQRAGFYPAPSSVPADVPGLEFSGTIAEVGREVKGWAVGDRVMGIVGGGGMAELVVTESGELLRVPEALSLEQAAAVPEVFLTVFDGVVLQGGLATGDAVLFHAVASGIGTAGIQIARALGATSVGTTRTADKLARCQALGLDHAVLVDDGKFAEAVLSSVPKGVDVILDTVGAAYLGQNVKVLAKRGRIVVIGLMGGVKGELPLGALLAKRGSVRGSVLRSRPSHEKAALTHAFADQMLARFDDGALEPVIDEVLPMTEIRAAHERMDSNQTFGKLVLSWG
ncbi:MAG: NAD(P)H-quinone oxidoreductase [Myxococcota bacterium]